jgi:hypothetical protein
MRAVYFGGGKSPIVPAEDDKEFIGRSAAFQFGLVHFARWQSRQP